MLVKASFSQTTTCNTATVLTAVNASSCTPGTTFNISGTGTGPTMSSCSTGGTATNNWGQFVANGTTATISYDPAANRDAMIYAYSGTCPGGLTQIGCVDDFGNGTQEDLVLTSLTAGATYYVRIVRYGSNNNMNGSICIASASSTNTITTGTISGSPFCAGASVSVPFTSSGTFSGNTYTAQLSDASGSFSSPVSIGTLVSNSNSGSISATLPAGTGAGTGYRIRVISSSPATTGSDNGSALTINAIPSSPTAGNSSRCGTGTVTISATPGTGQTIDWYAASTGGTALVTGNTSYTTGSISSTTTYYAQARNTTTGCLSAARIAVNATVNAVPASPAAGNSSRCGTGTVTISATPGTGQTIDWYAASTGGTALVTGNTSYTTGSISSTTTYYAQARNTTTGCLSAARIAVTATVNALPSSPTAGNNSRCGTGTVTISATPGTGQTIDWYAASTGGTALVTGNTSYTTGSISSTTTYYAQARNTTTGCLSATRTAVNATVNAVPADKTVSATAAICTGASTNIQVAASEAGVNYQLRNNSGNTNIGSTVSGNLFNINLNTSNLTTTTTFNVLATNGTTGCAVQMTNTPTVTVNNPAATAGPNISACQSLTPAAITLTGASVSGGATTGAWSIISGTGTLSSTAQTGSPAAVTFLPDDNYTGTVTLRLTTNTPGGCTAGTSTRNIVVNPKPVATITANHCLPGGVVRLSVNSFASYLWNTTGQTTQTIDVLTAGNYVVTVTDVNGCVATDTYTTGTELVTNGDFNAGNTGFSTAYVYTPNIAGNTELYPEGYYAVGNNANDYHNSFNGTDHTSGSGNFMIINGTITADQIVWSQNSIAVAPNTNYYFSAWGLTVVNGNNAILRFSINGTQVGTSASLPNGYTSASGPFAWTRFFGSWNSGSATVANLSIVNLQLAAGGNDFGIDDISFSTLPPFSMTTAPSSSGGSIICTNSPINLLSNVAGGNYPLTYAWTGPNSFTSTSQNPVITSAVAANAGMYNLTVTDKYGCNASGSSSTVTILPSITNNTVSAAQSICTNTTPAALTGSTPSGGNGSYTYLWESSTTSASAGFTTASGTSNGIGYTPGILYQNTWYRRTVTSGTCTDVSAAIQITVNPIIGNNSFTSAQTICSGSTPAAFAGATPTGGNGTYTYLWESSTTSASAGFGTAAGTSNGINYSPAALTQNTWFRRTVTSGGCSSTSTVLLITVNPVIGNHTVSAAQAICSGSTPASLTNSTPTGGSGIYSYVWESSTTSAAAGFAAASGSNLFQNYNPPALTQTTWYRTIITSGGCTSTATAIAITVTPPIATNTISASQTICTGTAPATLTGSTPTGGNGSYTYAWERSTTSATVGFAAATGTNNAQNYSPATLTQTTWFRRTVTSGSCSSVSATVQVTITPVINTNTITAAQTICSGSTPAALSGSTPTGGSGSGTYTYLWESSTTSAAAGFSTATGTSNTIGYSPAALTQTTWFRRTVTSGGCTNTSATVQITVTPAIANNTVSAAQSICTGTAPAALTGTTPTGGTGSYTYLWQSSTTSASAGFGTASGTSNGVNYTPGTLSQTTWYRRTVISGSCTDVSAAIQITVSPIIGNNSFTSAQTICSGSTPAAFAGATPTGGNGTYTYLWESSTTSASAGFGTAAGTSNGINYSPAALTQNTWFRRTVTSGGCSSTSTAILITVNPVIGNHTVSAAQAICSGSTPSGLTNSTPTGGSGIYSYVWESSTTSAAAGFAAAGGSNLFQNYNPPALTQTTWFRTTITSGGCTSTATAIAITVTPAIATNTITASQTICTATAPATLAGSTPTGGNGSYTYLWERSTTSATFGFAAASGTNNTKDYSPSTLTQTTWFRRTVTSGSCSSVSATLQVTITPVINTNTITAAQTICSGSTPAALTGSTPTGGSGSGTYTYLWESSTTSAAAGFSTATGTSNTIGYTPAALTQTTWFRRTVTSGGCSSTSATVQITVTPVIINNTLTAGSTICSGGSAAVTGSLPTGGNGSYSYSWESSTTSASAGFAAVACACTAQNLPATVLTQNTWFRRTVSSGGCSSTSAAVLVTVNPAGQWIGGASGNWNVAGNWCGGIPTNATNVNIPSGSTITIQSTNAVANNVTIAAGGSLVMTGAHNLTISAGGSFTNNGTFTASASTGSVIFNGNGTISGTTTFQNIDTKVH